MNIITTTIKESEKELNLSFPILGKKISTQRGVGIIELWEDCRDEVQSHISQSHKAVLESVRNMMDEGLIELLKLEKERDEEYEQASTRHKYHPSEETLAKMKSLENANDTYRSGIRQGKIEVKQDILKIIDQTLSDIEK